MKELYLWPINADEQGTPQQVRKVIDPVRKNKIPVVFSESTISDKPAKQVAKETGARYGGVLYVDSLSDANGPVPTYLEAARSDRRDHRQGLRQVNVSRSRCREAVAAASAPLPHRRCATSPSPIPTATRPLHDATFELGPGTICALVGVNGSGKSTLFKAIMGFVAPVGRRGAHLRAAGARGAEAQPRRLRAAERRMSTGTSRCWSRTS